MTKQETDLIKMIAEVGQGFKNLPVVDGVRTNATDYINQLQLLVFAREGMRTYGTNLAKSEVEKMEAAGEFPKLPGWGMLAIIRERQEQIAKHHYTFEHDQQYYNLELVRAAEYCLKLAGCPIFSQSEGCRLPTNWGLHFKNRIRSKTIKQRAIVGAALLLAENARVNDDYWDEEIKIIAQWIETGLLLNFSNKR